MKYSPEIMLQAYASIKWKNEYIGEMLLPEGDSIDLQIDIPKESCEEQLKHLLASLYLIDFFVQQGTNEYEIAYMEIEEVKEIKEIKEIEDIEDIEDIKVSIGYWGMYENTQFDVQCYLQSGVWYCIAMGTERYNPPIKIA